MKYLLFFLLTAFCLLLITPVRADSQRAYQDYLYQNDVYRQKYNDFQIARNEYFKFNTLASEASAITKTRDMLSQRALLLRAYLLLLNEKIKESKGMSDANKGLYQTLINNEIQFLENHSQFVKSVETLKDAQKASEQLESHYIILQISIRQIVLGIIQAKLNVLGTSYSDRLIEAKTVIDQAKMEFPLAKQNIMDRWFQQISNKRSIYLNKYDSLSNTITSLKGSSEQNLDKTFTENLQLVADAKLDLREGTSYFKELILALKYTD